SLSIGRAGSMWSASLESVSDPASAGTSAVRAVGYAAQIGASRFVRLTHPTSSGRQAFRLERLLYFRARAHAIDVGLEIRPLGKVDADARGPAQDSVEVGVRHAELVSHQVLLAGELLVEPIETLAEVLLGDGLVGIGRRRP